MPRQRNYGRTTHVATLRHQRWLEMWLYQKMSYAQIAAAEGASKDRVAKVVRAALQRAARQNEELAHLGGIQALYEINVVAREAYDALTRMCPKCHGHGTRNDVVCLRCEGTGQWYDTADRRKWAAQLLRAADQRAKLQGHYAPTDHRLVGDDGEALSVREILVRMAPEEVAREAAWFLEGVAYVEDNGGAGAATTTQEGGSASE